MSARSNKQNNKLRPYLVFRGGDDKRRPPNSGTPNETTEFTADALGVVGNWNPGCCHKYFSQISVNKRSMQESIFTGELRKK